MCWPITICGRLQLLQAPHPSYGACNRPRALWSRLLLLPQNVNMHPMLLYKRHSITVSICVVAVSLQQLHMAPLDLWVQPLSVVQLLFVDDMEPSVCSAGTTGDSHV